MNQTVLVTGATGYLASWVVEYFLSEGHTVHGTLRNLKDMQKIEHLVAMSEKYPNQLHLFEADLLKPGSFDLAMKGCTLVIHTASAYLFEKTKNPEQALLRPALEGTQNVINSIERCLSVRRLVLTSSIVALYDNARDVNTLSAGVVKTDSVNAGANLKNNAYAYAKTQAEQWAWEVQRRQTRWSMVSIHPGAIFGPSLTSRVDSTSINMMRQFINGSFRRGVPKLWLGLVDVRDAAKAHVRAAFQGLDQSRYIAVSKSMRLIDIAQAIDGQRFNIVKMLPSSEAPKWMLWLLAPLIGMERRYIATNVNFPLTFDNSASKTELGIDYIEPSKTLNDQIAQLFFNKIAT